VLFTKDESAVLTYKWVRHQIPNFELLWTKKKFCIFLTAIYHIWKSSLLWTSSIVYGKESVVFCRRGTAVAQWLRRCATNRKVVGSIPVGVTGIFHWYNPSDRTMTLESTQPLTEKSTRSISWGIKNRPVRKADNLTTILGHCHVIRQS